MPLTLAYLHLEAGATTEVLERQSPELSKAALLAKQGNFSQALEKLDHLVKNGNEITNIRLLAQMLRNEVARRQNSFVEDSQTNNAPMRTQALKIRQRSLRSLYDVWHLGNVETGTQGHQIDVTSMMLLAEFLGPCTFAAQERLSITRITKQNPDLVKFTSIQESEQNLNACIHQFDAVIKNLRHAGINSVDVELRRLRLESRIARAHLKLGIARDLLRRGSQLAASEGRACEQAEMFLALGDLDAAPDGAVETLGFDIFIESISFQEHAGTNSAFQLKPKPLTPDALAAARSAYAAAANSLQRCTRPSTYKLALRDAYLAFATGQPHSPALYSEAARLARKAGALRDAALAEATAGLLGNDGELLRKATKQMQECSDSGAAATIAQLAAALYARRYFLGAEHIQIQSMLWALIEAFESHGFNLMTSDARRLLARIHTLSGQMDHAASELQQVIQLQRFLVMNSRQAQRQYTETEQEQLKKLLPPVIHKQLEGIEVRFQQLISHEHSRLAITLRQMLDTISFAALDSHDDWSEVWLHTEREIRQLQNAVQGDDEYVRELLKNLINDLSESRPSPVDQILAIEKKYNDCSRRMEAFASLMKSLKRNPTGPFPLISEIRLLEHEGRCDLNKLSEARRRLSQHDPVQPFLEAVAAYQVSPEVNFDAMMQATYRLTLMLGMALRLRAYDVIESWFERLAPALTTHEVANQIRFIQAFRIPVLIETGKSQTAIELGERILASTPRSELVFARLRVWCLYWMVEARSTMDEPKRFLLEWERFRNEERVFHNMKNSFAAVSPEAAELKQMELKLAYGTTALSSKDLERIRALRSKVSTVLPQESQLPSLEEVDQFLAALPPKTTILVLHEGNTAVTILQLTRSTSKLTRSPVNSYEIAKKVELLRTGLSSRSKTWIEPSRKLHQWLFTETQIEPGAMVIFLSSGRLHGLPFELLMDTSNSFFLKRHVTFHAESFWDTQVPTSCSKFIKGQSSLVVGVNGQLLQTAEAEANEVAERIGAEPLIADKATLKEIQARIGSARYIHFATHGMLESRNPYATSLLVARGEPVEAWWLWQNALRPELVFLSACDSYKIVETREMFLDVALSPTTLAEVSFATGARWTVASGWMLSDDDAMQVVIEFYTKLLEGQSPPEALRHAKLERLKKTPGLDPHFFGSLTLSARSVRAVARCLAPQP